ncbi:MAG: periplasmic heavy metal sensor [Terrimicrobiaceae bacterium]|nr:periplasmic heavy metal sensor [Terrimicrobiaceae bacterium]
MKKTPSVLLFLLVVSVVAAIASCLSLMLYSKMNGAPSPNTHEWVHTQLGLTPEQKKALAPIEKIYGEKRGALEHQMLLANRELAEAILADGKDSERVHAAIEKIHDRMGELQKVTIGHVFEMRKVLSPGQYRKLLDRTAHALYNLDSQHGGE